MTQEEIEKKQSDLAYLAVEISRLRKLIGLKQTQFNKIDKELYLHFKNQPVTDEQTTIAEDNK